MQYAIWLQHVLEEHVNHVKNVLSHLLQNLLSVKFLVTQVLFLGYIICPEVVTMDSGKVTPVTTSTISK